MALPKAPVAGLAFACALWACHAVPRAATPTSAATQSAAGALSSVVLELQRDIERILASPPLERTFWGIAIQSPTANDTVYSLNARKLLMPASALKVVTVATAAERLGWDYRYETRLVADGAIDGETLDGNLVVVGNGDPSLDRPTLDAWVAQVRASGITRVTGTVLADARAFGGEGLGFGW